MLMSCLSDLDSVVSTGQLSTFADGVSTILEALFIERVRWHAPVLTSTRCTIADDSCRHFRYGQCLVILHGDRTHTDPLEFKPERFLGNSKEHFGFEGTVLTTQSLPSQHPGRFLAWSPVWLTCAQSVFDISEHREGREGDTRVRPSGRDVSVGV
ncbi:hypothetical protein HD554DRAFT_2035228 [Boletus coccyginus]|nr:hypothetical protein HD554DRAFT_2035228 [Boletus coccyginus]